jgi:very-short-patch-repair endonuclease
MRAPLLTFKRARGLRREMNLPEVVLWRMLRNGRLNGLRFRRQHPIEPYILDFYCPAARIAVEIDGEGHGHPERARHDASRDSWLASQDIRVLRFAAKDVLKDASLADILTVIAQAAAPSVGFADSSPVNGGAPGAPSRAPGSSPAKRGRGTMRSVVEGAAVDTAARSSSGGENRR